MRNAMVSKSVFSFTLRTPLWAMPSCLGYLHSMRIAVLSINQKIRNFNYKNLFEGRGSARGTSPLLPILALTTFLGLPHCDGCSGGGKATPSLTPLSLEVAASHSCVLFSDFSLKCWGYNEDGQLGLEDANSRGDEAGEMGDMLSFIDIGKGHTARAIAAGSAHTCAILDDDSLKCWGNNGNGQLGLGDITRRSSSATAVNLGTGDTARAIAAGSAHTCAILSNAILDDDSLKCWGDNGNGQLGLGDITRRSSPAAAVNIGTGHTARAIAAGDKHTCAILDDDSLKCWGDNEDGQLGLGDTIHRGGKAGEMGDILPAVNLGTGRTARTVAVGSAHTCAILDDDSLKCWGYNEDGQLGLGDTIHRGGKAGEMGDILPAVNLGTGRTAPNGRCGLCSYLRHPG